MKRFFYFVLLLTSVCMQAQKYGNIWMFGNNAGLDFNGCSPVPVNVGKNSGFEGCSAISDSTGQLLFYTNSDSVWNKQHVRMPNGNLIGSGGTLSQVLIIPRPGSVTKYYIFTTVIQGNITTPSLKLQYHEVDMSLVNGLGNVGSKNNVLTNTVVTEQVAATWHSNGTDIWVMAHAYGTNKFMAYLVTAAGITATPVVSAVGPAHGVCTSNINARGEIKFSPNGARLAFNGNGEGNNNDPSNILAVFDFNTSTGVVSNPINLPFCRGDFGLSFSADNSKLYGGTWKAFNFTFNDYNYLYQFDLSLPTASAVAASRIKIDSMQLITGNYGSLKLAPDGRIYVARSNSGTLGVINTPNQAGALACNYVPNGQSLGGATCNFGLNNYIEYQSYCKPLITGISEQAEALAKSSVSPNPFSGAATLNFQNPYGDLFTLSIYDAQGKLVQIEQHISGDNIALSSQCLEAGLYFYTLQSASRSLKGKMLVMDK